MAEDDAARIKPEIWRLMNQKDHPVKWLSLLAALVVVGACFASQVVRAQAPNAAGTAIKGSFQKITVHGRSLEGNLEGDSLDRDVFVYLPPSYARETTRRYPVVYFLTVTASTQRHTCEC